jgi:hypothetical protein
MAALEPEQRTRGAALEEGVTRAWVASLVDEAEHAERARDPQQESDAGDHFGRREHDRDLERA